MGGEMTPLPPACVAAVRELPMSAHPEEVARAVLDAFVAGEGEGRWKVRRDMLTDSWEIHDHKTGNIMVQSWPTEAKALSVANVLNYLEAKGE